MIWFGGSGRQEAASRLKEEVMSRIALKTALSGVLGLAIATAALVRATSNEAFGVPISDRLVRGEVRLLRQDLKPAGQRAIPAVTFAAREGSVVSIQHADSEKALGLSPAILGGADESPSFLVLELSGDDLGDVSGTGLIPAGSDEILDTAVGPVELRFDRVVAARFPVRAPAHAADFRPTELRRFFGRSGEGTCCVTCGPITSCATEIRMACGICVTEVREVE
jgi:hypothetical protein